MYRYWVRNNGFYFYFLWQRRRLPRRGSDRGGRARVGRGGQPPWRTARTRGRDRGGKEQQRRTAEEKEQQEEEQIVIVVESGKQSLEQRYVRANTAQHLTQLQLPCVVMAITIWIWISIYIADSDSLKNFDSGSLALFSNVSGIWM